MPGISIAEGWDQTAKVMKEIALVRSMTNKEGNHQRAAYQLHTGYVPTATLKHPHIGCSIAAELGESKFDLPHIVSIGGADDRRRVPGCGARAVRGPEPRAAAGQHPAQGRGRPVQAPARSAQSPRDRGLRARPGGWTGCATIAPSTPRRPGWSSRPT